MSKSIPNKFADAIAAVCGTLSDKDCYKWFEVALEFLFRLQDVEIDLEKIEFSDGILGECGDGQLTIYYNGTSADDAQTGFHTIKDTCVAMQDDGWLEIDDQSQYDGWSPWVSVVAKRF